MKSKILHLIWFLMFLIIFSGAGCFQKEKPAEVEKGLKSEKEQAIEKAKELFRQKQEEGMDMSAGPCLSNEIIPGWVADVAHSPRQPIDNQPENQCQAYREGKAKHFVELDPEGNLIKAH